MEPASLHSPGASASIFTSFVAYGAEHRERESIAAFLAECDAEGLESRVVITDNYERYTQGELERLREEWCEGPLHAAWFSMDMSETDETLPESGSSFPNSRVVFFPTLSNLGYARAHNLAYRLGGGSGYSAFLAATPDVRIETPGGIRTLLARLEAEPDAGVVGPCIVDGNNRRQGPFRFQGAAQRYGPLLAAPLVRLATGSYFIDDTIRSPRRGPVYRLMGCFLLFRPQAFEAAGGFDPQTFLYAEESIIAERLHSVGFRCHYEDSVTVRHEKGTTIGSHFDSAESLRLRFESDMIYYTAYAKSSRIGTAIARAGMWMFLRVWLPLHGVLHSSRPAARTHGKRRGT
ncbi:MAG: hypothetical protein QHI48_02915 [Bacteroidota bacterium]|nr:hypothetical protein [Bacteroidota bacterium]